MGLTEKISNAINNTDEIKSYFEDKIPRLTYLIKEGEIFPAIGFACHMFTAYDPYVWYISKTNQSSRIVKCILSNGIEMYIDLSDEGISRDLFYDGIRERETVSRYIDELKRLKEGNESVTILEIGCNIGYYLLIAGLILDEEDTVFAFEPEPQNVSLAKKNVDLNSLLSIVDIHQYAIGGEEGIAEFRRHPSHSNWGHMTGTDRTRTGRDSEFMKGEVVEVDVLPIDKFMRDNSLDSEYINVVRMDVEGYEYKVIEGMEETVKRADSLLVSIEVHPIHMEQNDINEFIDYFSSNGYDIHYSEPQNVSKFEDLRDVGAVRLTIRK